MFSGYSLGDNNYEGAQSNVNGDELRVYNVHTQMLRNTRMASYVTFQT